MDGNPGAMSEMEKLKSGKWVQQETGNLVIPEADRHDSGKYTCSGSAFDDHLSAQSQVTVNCKLLMIFRKTSRMLQRPGRQIELLSHLTSQYLNYLPEDLRPRKDDSSEVLYVIYLLIWIMTVGFRGKDTSDQHWCAVFHAKFATHKDLTLLM